MKLEPSLFNYNQTKRLIINSNLRSLETKYHEWFKMRINNWFKVVFYGFALYYIRRIQCIFSTLNIKKLFQAIKYFWPSYLYILGLFKDAFFPTIHFSISCGCGQWMSSIETYLKKIIQTSLSWAEPSSANVRLDIRMQF